MRNALTLSDQPKDFITTKIRWIDMGVLFLLSLSQGKSNLYYQGLQKMKERIGVHHCLCGNGEATCSNRKYKEIRGSEEPTTHIHGNGDWLQHELFTSPRVKRKNIILQRSLTIKNQIETTIQPSSHPSHTCTTIFLKKKIYFLLMNLPLVIGRSDFRIC